MDYQSILPKPIGAGNKIIRTIEDVRMLRAIKLQSPFHFRAAMWIRFHIPLDAKRNLRRVRGPAVSITFRSEPPAVAGGQIKFINTLPRSPILTMS